jgi:hypothetical protein
MIEATIIEGSNAALGVVGVMVLVGSEEGMGDGAAEGASTHAPPAKT